MEKAFDNEDTIANFTHETCAEEYPYNMDSEFQNHVIVETSPKGRFIRFNEELGSGAYKKVYRGYDRDTGCEIAWNVIKLARLPQKERKRVSDEISLLRSLNHPNIMQFISAWINKSKKEVVFISEVVTGGSLKQYLRKTGNPKLKVIKSWCKNILLGLEYLHNLEPNIIHRDIKCDNIFINSNNGEIRIGDLGLATCMRNEFASSVLGTPEFMAPEMYDEIYGPLVDIYSFGMCVLEMVTLQTPYSECKNPGQIYKKVLSGQKPDAINLIINDDVRNFILECLQPKENRPSASMLLKHEFLKINTGESDNEPVQLKKSCMSKIEEESIEMSNMLNQPSVKILEKDWKKPNKYDYFNKSTSEKETSIENEKSSQEKAVIHDFTSYDKGSVPSQTNDIKVSKDISTNILKDQKKHRVYVEVDKNCNDNSHLQLHIKLIENKCEERILAIEKSKFKYPQIIEIIKHELNLSSMDESAIQNIKKICQINQPSPLYSVKAPSNNEFQKKVREADIHIHEKSHAFNYILISEHFRTHYKAYLIATPTDYLDNETEDSMNKRHTIELHELQKLQEIQRKAFFSQNRKQQYIASINLNSTYHTHVRKIKPGNSSFLPTESNTYEVEEGQQKTNFRNYNDLRFVSPAPSHISYQIDQNEFCSGNDSAGAISILQHLGNNQCYIGSLISGDESNKSHIGTVFAPSVHDNFGYIISPNHDVLRKIDKDKAQDCMLNNTTINQTINQLVGNINATINSTQTNKQNENCKLKQQKIEKNPIQEIYIKMREDPIGSLGEKNLCTPKNEKRCYEDQPKNIITGNLKYSEMLIDKVHNKDSQDQIVSERRKNKKKSTKFSKKDEDLTQNNQNFEVSNTASKIPEIYNEKLLNSESPGIKNVIQRLNNEMIIDATKHLQVKAKTLQPSEIFSDENPITKSANEFVIIDKALLHSSDSPGINNPKSGKKYMSRDDSNGSCEIQIDLYGLLNTFSRDLTLEDLDLSYLLINQIKLLNKKTDLDLGLILKNHVKKEDFTRLIINLLAIYDKLIKDQDVKENIINEEGHEYSKSSQCLMLINTIKHLETIYIQSFKPTINNK